MNKKNYVLPGIEIHRVIMETTIADTPLSVQSSVEKVSWEDGGIIGDQPNENGDVLFPWAK